MTSDLEDPGESVQTVPHRNVDRLPENPVATLRVGDDLRERHTTVRPNAQTMCG